MAPGRRSLEGLSLRGPVPVGVKPLDVLGAYLELGSAAVVQKFLQGPTVEPFHQQLREKCIFPRRDLYIQEHGNSGGGFQGPTLKRVMSLIEDDEVYGWMKYAGTPSADWTTDDWYAWTLVNIIKYNVKHRDGCFFQKSVSTSDQYQRGWMIMIRQNDYYAPSKVAARKRTSDKRKNKHGHHQESDQGDEEADVEEATEHTPKKQRMDKDIVSGTESPTSPAGESGLNHHLPDDGGMVDAIQCQPTQPPQLQDQSLDDGGILEALPCQPTQPPDVNDQSLTRRPIIPGLTLLAQFDSPQQLGLSPGQAFGKELSTESLIDNGHGGEKTPRIPGLSLFYDVESQTQAEDDAFLN